LKLLKNKNTFINLNLFNLLEYIVRDSLGISERPNDINKFGDNSNKYLNIETTNQEVINNEIKNEENIKMEDNQIKDEKIN